MKHVSENALFFFFFFSLCEAIHGIWDSMSNSMPNIRIRSTLKWGLPGIYFFFFFPKMIIVISCNNRNEEILTNIQNLCLDNQKKKSHIYFLPIFENVIIILMTKVSRETIWQISRQLLFIYYEEISLKPSNIYNMLSNPFIWNFGFNIPETDTKNLLIWILQCKIW